MKYLCLRKCYTGDRLYDKDVIYDLSDDMVKSEKNFRLVGSDIMQAIPAPKVVEAMPAPSESATGDAEEKPPLYISPNPKPKKKRKKNA